MSVCGGGRSGPTIAGAGVWRGVEAWGGRRDVPAPRLAQAGKRATTVLASAASPPFSLTHTRSYQSTPTPSTKEIMSSAQTAGMLIVPTRSVALLSLRWTANLAPAPFIPHRQESTPTTGTLALSQVARSQMRVLTLVLRL